NGGIFELPVRVDVTAHPFLHPPFHGAIIARDLAVRLRTDPKAAVPLLTGGEIARWFETNGWAYPVAGPTVPTLAAVQQFFESMGLAKPPRVLLAETEA